MKFIKSISLILVIVLVCSNIVEAKSNRKEEDKLNTNPAQSNENKVLENPASKTGNQKRSVRVSDKKVVQKTPTKPLRKEGTRFGGSRSFGGGRSFGASRSYGGGRSFGGGMRNYSSNISRPHSYSHFSRPSYSSVSRPYSSYYSRPYSGYYGIGRGFYGRPYGGYYGYWPRYYNWGWSGAYWWPYFRWGWLRGINYYPVSYIRTYRNKCDNVCSTYADNCSNYKIKYSSNGYLKCECEDNDETTIIEKYCWTPKSCIEAKSVGCQSIIDRIKSKKTDFADEFKRKK